MMRQKRRLRGQCYFLGLFPQLEINLKDPYK